MGWKNEQHLCLIAPNTMVQFMRGSKITADKNRVREIINLTAHRMYMWYEAWPGGEELTDHGEHFTCFYRYN